MRDKDQILLESLYLEGLYSYDTDYELKDDEMKPLYIKGEYWFDEYGDIMYADGDYGDMNHEAYVMDRCAGEILNEFGLHEWESPVNLDEYIDEIIEIIINQLEIDDDDAKKEEIRDDPYDAIINYLKNHTTMKGPIEEIVYLAGGRGGDGREFAIKEWRWSRVHQNHIEVKELTPKQLKIVARGINTALDQEGVYGDDKWLRASQSEYNISTYTGKRYEIKLEDMEKGNVEGLERADIEHTTSAATDQVRQLDVSQTPSFYKGHLGDSYVLNKDTMILEYLYEKIILTENKDGRLAETNAKEIFGSDEEPFFRGYIYQDGTFLNLGEGQDHREINFAYFPDKDEYPNLKEIDIPENNLGSSKYMIHFMTESGAVRWGRYNGRHLGLSYIQKLTSAQKRAITKIIDRYNISTVSVDVYSPRYETLKSVEGEVWDDDVQRLI